MDEVHKAAMTLMQDQFGVSAGCLFHFTASHLLLELCNAICP